jgi:hypothetical protein
MGRRCDPYICKYLCFQAVPIGAAAPARRDPARIERADSETFPSSPHKGSRDGTHQPRIDSLCIEVPAPPPPPAAILTGSREQSRRRSQVHRTRAAG